MNPELLAAYHYLSSAIAQAFAALIALTAMFYIYRRGTYRQIKTKLLDISLFLKAKVPEMGTPEYDKWVEKKFELIDSSDELTISSQKLDRLAVSSIVLSAFTMLAGIVALLFGWLVYDISLVLTLGIMAFESILAGIALIWTVIVVIKMLKEPEESKAEDG